MDVCESRRGTYTHLTSWLTDARNLTNPSTTILLIGNKKDLEAQREVTYEGSKQVCPRKRYCFVGCLMQGLTFGL